MVNNEFTRRAFLKYAGLFTGLGLIKPLSKADSLIPYENEHKFMGLYYAHIDAKGAFLLPDEFSDTLTSRDNTIYITNAAFDRCLHVYPISEWKQLRSKTANLDGMEEAVKYFLRRVIASAQSTKVSRSGCIALNKTLMGDAGIGPDTEVAIVGQLNKIELWSREEWKAVTDPAIIDAQRYEEALAQYGF